MAENLNNASNTSNVSNWKQVGDVIKTEGNILEIGSFISHSGNKVDISPEDAKLLFNNIDESIPFVIKHEDGFQEEVGHATQFAENDTGIGHKGIVFNTDNVKNAIAMGYNSISPVIDFEKDSSGKVVSGKIVKLAFVPNPAMQQTKVNMTRFAFSAPEVNSMTVPDEQPVTTVNIQGTQVPTDTFVQPTAPIAPTTPTPAFDPQDFAKNIAASIVEGFSTKIGGQLEAMQQEIAALKSNTPQPLEPSVINNLATVQPVSTEQPAENIPKELLDQFTKLQAENITYKAQLDKDEKAAYTAKLAEFRALGQESPEKLVAHIKDTKLKIETLDALKVAIVKNTPMNSPQSTPLGVEGGKNQSTKPTVIGLAESLKMQLDQETAERLSKTLRIPVQ